MRDLISAEDRRQLEEKINHAATNQLDWRWFLADLHRISGGARAHMTIVDKATMSPVSMLQFGFDPEYVESLRNHFGKLNVWAHYANSMPIGTYATTREAVSDDDLKQTEFYQDWVRPQENALGGAATVLADDGSRRFAFGGIVREVDREALEPRFVEILKFVAPRLRQAVAVNKMLAGASLEQHIMREAMHPAAAACFVLSPDRQLMFANKTGEALISTGSVVGCDNRAKLRFSKDRPNQKLASALFSLANSDTRFQLPFFSGSQNPRNNFICRVIGLGTKDRLPTPFPLDHYATGYALLLMTRIH